MDNNLNALSELLKDLYKTECIKNHRKTIVIYILMFLLIISICISLLLYRELKSYELVTITETTEETYSYDNDVEGDGANIVNGNQYNDSAVHNEK